MLLENFLINALETLLENLTVERQDKLLAAVREKQGLLTIGSVNRLRNLLTRIDRKDALSMFEMDFKTLNWSPEEINCIERRFFQVILADAFFQEGAFSLPKTGLKHFGAFLQLAQIMKVPVSDLRAWKDFGDLSPIHELLRVAAIIFGLSLKRLSAEIQFFKKYSCDKNSFKDYFSVMDMVPSVDAPEVNWERSKQVEFDNTVLEGLVHHQSLWLKFLAACVLDARLSGTERFEVCKRLLENGRNETFYLVAKIAGELPHHESHELILARLREPLTPGVHYLFELLAEEEFPVDQSYIDILKLGFMSSSPKVAESAAKWCKAGADGSEGWLRRLLRQAFKFWTKNEQPYPEKGGVVPDSPRKEIYCALQAIDNFKFDELVKLALEKRRDISDLAMKDLVSLVSKSDDDRNRLVDELCARRFPPTRCKEFFDVRIPYSQENLTALSALLKDDDPDFRCGGIRILSHPNIVPSEH